MQPGGERERSLWGGGGKKILPRVAPPVGNVSYQIKVLGVVYSIVFGAAGTRAMREHAPSCGSTTDSFVLG